MTGSETQGGVRCRTALPLGTGQQENGDDRRCSKTGPCGACGLGGWFLLSAQVGHHDQLTTEWALDVVTAADASGAAQPLGPEVLEALVRAVPADHASYFEWRVRDHGCEVFVGDPWDVHLNGAMGEWCSSYPLRDRDHAASSRPLRTSDVVSAQRFRRTQYYNDVLRPLGFRHELKLWLTAPLGYARCFEFVRGPGRDFDEQEVGFLSLVRPYLSRIRNRWRPDPVLSSLTERERDVLELLALGLTNREIAQHLFISPMTVRTHLVNMFRKLGVGTRTAAVAAAHRLAS
jgi:DNA-binding CsgD family transcriptional regulator